MTFNKLRLKKYKKIKTISGIYFLFKNNKVIYIGQSKNVISRIYSHRFSRELKFDEGYYFIVNSLKDLDAIERYLISIVKPKANKIIYKTPDISKIKHKYPKIFNNF